MSVRDQAAPPTKPGARAVGSSSRRSPCRGAGRSPSWPARRHAVRRHPHQRGRPRRLSRRAERVGVAGAVGAGRGTRRALLCNWAANELGPGPTVRCTVFQPGAAGYAARRYARHSSQAARQCGIPFLRVADAGATVALVCASGGRLVVEPRADRLMGAWPSAPTRAAPLRRARPAQGARMNRSWTTKDAGCSAACLRWPAAPRWSAVPSTA